MELLCYESEKRFYCLFETRSISGSIRFFFRLEVVGAGFVENFIYERKFLKEFYYLLLL